MTMVFQGAEGVKTYRAIALKVALKTYARCGLRMNRGWTPTAMLKAAGTITGKVYKRGQYDLAAMELDAWVNAHGTTGEVA